MADVFLGLVLGSSAGEMPVAVALQDQCQRHGLVALANAEQGTDLNRQALEYLLHAPAWQVGTAQNG